MKLVNGGANVRAAPRCSRRADLPNLVIIGAAKAGTTALHQSLDRHPEIAMSEPKELNFFHEKLNWRRGVEWYASHFDTSAPVRGETSPSYTTFPFARGVPERMYEVIPDAKLIYAVRDPIERILSQHRFSRVMGHNWLPLERELVPLSTNYFVQASRYASQLERFLEFYPLDRIHVLCYEEFRARPADALRSVFDFLGVAQVSDPADFVRPANVTSDLTSAEILRSMLRRVRAGTDPLRYPKAVFEVLKHPSRLLFHLAPRREDLSADLRRRLRDVLADDVERFRKLTGRRFEQWQI